MRSSVLLSAAVCAAGVCATPLDVEKRAYETEWSFFTLTSTSTTELPPVTTWSTVQETGAPAAEATTYTLPPVTIGEGQPAPAPTTLEAQQPAPEPQTSTVEAPAPAAPTQDNAADNGGGWTSSWSTAWTVPADAPTEQPQTQAPAPTQQAQSTLTSATSGAAPTNSYQDAILYNHNIHRSNHSSSSLTWSNTLESSAHKLAQGCVYKHDTSIDGGGYGQNIGYGVSADNVGQMITNLMYNDEMGLFGALYGIASPLMELFDSWGHFTQIVWKSTAEVGCATVVCDSLGNVDSGSSLPFTVCNYSPAGNSNGEYADNVLQPQGQPIFTA